MRWIIILTMLHHYRIFFALLTLIVVNCFAEKVDPLTYCLGQEELKFHKDKEVGPFYKLNQVFINDISSFGGALLKPQYLQKVCGAKKHASFELLKVLALEGKNAFVSSKNLNIYQKASLQTLIDSVPSTFTNFIGGLSSLFPSASCLPKYAPDIPYYLERIKYLETDLSKKELLSDKRRLKKIFRTMGNVQVLISKCQKEMASGKK